MPPRPSARDPSQSSGTPRHRPSALPPPSARAVRWGRARLMRARLRTRRGPCWLRCSATVRRPWSNQRQRRSPPTCVPRARGWQRARAGANVSNGSDGGQGNCRTTSWPHTSWKWRRVTPPPTARRPSLPSRRSPPRSRAAPPSRAGSPLGPRASDAGPPQEEKKAELVAMLRKGAAPPAPRPAPPVPRPALACCSACGRAGRGLMAPMAPMAGRATVGRRTCRASHGNRGGTRRRRPTASRRPRRAASPGANPGTLPLPFPLPLALLYARCSEGLGSIQSHFQWYSEVGYREAVPSPEPLARVPDLSVRAVAAGGRR